MKTKFKIALTILLASSILCLGYAAILNTITVNNTCNVIAVGIGVYTNAGCTSPLTNIAWGDVPRGSQKTYQFWVRSESGNKEDIYMCWNTTGLPFGFILTCTANSNLWDLTPGYRTIGVEQLFACEFTLTVTNDAPIQAYNWYTHFSGSSTPP